MKNLRYLEDVATLKLDKSICIGCGRCVEVCPHQVFVVENKKASFNDFQACMECGACAKNCPVDAISVDAGVGCASGMINEWLREKKFPGTGSGGCC
jgi:NAD-dependent dihydropyrimidine dehydrogenase PreA subunit